jgi:hypothetical protein
VASALSSHPTRRPIRKIRFAFSLATFTLSVSEIFAPSIKLRRQFRLLKRIID